MPKKKPHPADAANAAIVAQAIRFDIALFLGSGRYATATAGTIDQARVEAARLAAAYGNGRRPLICGITADGRSGLVTHRRREPLSFPVKKRSAPQMLPSCYFLGSMIVRSCWFYWSGRRDLNSRPLVPQTSALTGLRHAPTGTARTIGPSATVDLISVSARMSQPYCKRPKRPLSRSRFLPCRARSASMFSNRWPSKRRSRWVGCCR